MKKNIIIKALCCAFAALAVCASLASCSGDNNEDGKIKVIGTVFPQYDFARQIGGERVDCEMLLSPGTDSHGYSGDNPSDILKIQKSDLFIYVGGETDEAWVSKVIDTIRSSGEKVPQTLALTDVCRTVEESDAGIIETEDGGNEKETEYDEHVWTSLSNSASAVLAIKDKLCMIDPEGKDYYDQRAALYADKLLELDRRFDELFSSSDNNTLVFADRFPFRYFALDHSLECLAAFNGCASQSEPSPTTIVKLCEAVKEKNLKYVFYTESSQSDVSRVIEKATGAKAMMLHSCHTVSEKQYRDGTTFVELWQKNLETLEKAFEND